jgi:hypothetical protein
MRAVDALRRIVNRMTESPRLAVTVKMRRSELPPLKVPPTITGKSEIVQGASTVRTPASTDVMRRIICGQYRPPAAHVK